METKCRKLQEQIDSSKVNNSSLQTKLSEMSHKCDSLARAAETYLIEKRNMKSKFDSVSQSEQHSKAQCAQFQKDITVKTAGCTTLQQKLQISQEQYAKLEISFKEQIDKCKVLQHNCNTIQMQYSQLQDKAKGTVEDALNHLPQLHLKQTLREYAQWIKNFCDGYHISECNMYAAVLSGTQEAYSLHTYIHFHNLDTIGQIINCNVAHLNKSQFLSLTWPDLNRLYWGSNCKQGPRGQHNSHFN